MTVSSGATATATACRRAILFKDRPGEAQPPRGASAGRGWPLLPRACAAGSAGSAGQEGRGRRPLRHTFRGD